MPWKLLPCMLNAQVLRPLVFEIHVPAPLLALLNVTALPLLLPSWLLFILMAVVTAPVFEIAVKVPDVTAEVVPRNTLLVIFTVLMPPEFIIPVKLVVLPVILLLSKVFPEIVNVMVLTPLPASIQRMAVDAAPSSVMVLLLIVLVNVPDGVPFEKSVLIPLNVVVEIPVLLVKVLYETLYEV